MLFPKILAGQRREPRFWTDILIMAAVLMDWLPSYVQAMLSGGAESGLIVSGSKLVILPLLLLDFVKSKEYWLRGFRIPLIVGGLFVLIFLPVMVHDYTAPLARIRPHVFNILLLFYFAHHRSFERCRFLMLFAVFCASTVPFAQVLVDLGVMQPLATHTGGGETVERFFAVTRTATVGVFSAYCLASLGGLVFVLHLRRWYLMLPISMVIMGASLMTPLFTSQRTVFIVALLSFIGGFLIFARARIASASLMAIVGALCAPLLLVFVSADLMDRWYYLMERFAGVDLGGFGTENSAYLRFQEIMMVLERMFPFPDFIGPGVIAYTSTVGVAPHTFVGALYFDGGILFLAIYTVFICYLGIAYCRSYMNQREPARRALLACYMVYFCAYFLNSLTMPIMGDRIVPFTLGMGLSILAACSPQRQHYPQRRQA